MAAVPDASGPSERVSWAEPEVTGIVAEKTNSTVWPLGTTEE